MYRHLKCRSLSILQKSCVFKDWNLTTQSKRNKFRIQHYPARTYSTDLNTTEKAIPKVIFKKPYISRSSEIKRGTVYHGFMCEDVQYIPEFNMTAIRLRHEQTQSEYLHIDRADTNNVFSINFRTTPFNSTGLPHILEHTVLCGSEKFPVRDPFFKMLNRSISNFMNAMTGPDFTFYPYCTLNEVDYRNLQSIYLDAVFAPNLDYIDFLQEGWRLEYSNLADKSSALTIKGVVYNEMKGVFSENSAIFSQALLNLLLPDHTYGHISGGDPLKIPLLTHNDLKAFHKMYYHPSNSRIYSYGNFPVQKSLQYVNEQYLSRSEGVDASYSAIPSQTRWTSAQSRHITSRFEKMGPPIEKQNHIAIGFLLNDITDVYETFLLQFLTELMIMGPNSFFYKSLIEPNISGGYSSATGYEGQLKDTMFVIGLQNIACDDFGKVSEIFLSTIEQVIDKGFDKNHVQAVLHTIELNIKHQSTKFGLNLLYGIAALWNHNGDVMQAMKMNSLLNRLKDNLKDPKYLQNRVQHYFTNNTHKLTLTMSPDLEYETKMAEAEKELLHNKIKGLTEAEKDSIFELGQALANSQTTKQNTEILPCLRLEDIPKTVKAPHLEHLNIGSVPVQVCEADTNGLTYFKAVLGISHLSDEQKMLVPLFNSMVTKLGTAGYDFREFDQLVSLNTSGLGLGAHVTENIDDRMKFEQGVFISSYCLDEKLKTMLHIWTEVLNSPLLKDLARFEMLLQNYMSNLTQGIASSGHLYAIQSSNSLLTDSGQLKDLLSGLKHIEFMKNLTKTRKPEEILSSLREMAPLLFGNNTLRVAVNITKPNKDVALNDLSDFFTSLPVVRKVNKTVWADSVTADDSDNTRCRCIHNVMNVPVHFCAKSIATVSYVSKDFATLRVLAKLLSSKYLHPIVREQNGAYGSGAKINIDGIFNFYSYRDPNSRKTLDVFDGAATWCAKQHSTWDNQVLFEAKLGVLQGLDAPIAESMKGSELFAHGLTHEKFLRHRALVLAVTANDLKKAAEKYLGSKRPTTKCVLGPKGEEFVKDDETWCTVDQE